MEAVQERSESGNASAATAGSITVLRKFVLAALLALGFAAAVPQGANAAPIGPAAALADGASQGAVHKAYWVVRRRYYAPRYFYRPRYYVRPRVLYYRPYVRRRFYW